MDRRDDREPADSSLATALRTAIARAPDLAPRPEFLSELQAQLRQTSAMARESPRRTPWPWWLASVAMVMLAVGIGARYWTAAAKDELAAVAVGDHRECALRMSLKDAPLSLDEAARQFGPVFRVVAQLPPTDIVTHVGRARVIDRHSCVYGGRRFAHVILRYEGQIVSVMVTGASANNPAGVSGPRVVDGMNVMSFRAGSQRVFIAGESAIDLKPLADAVTEALTRALGGV